MARTCPVCDIPLMRLQYEGLALFKCGKCSGHLVESQRMETIKHKRDVDSEGLMKEVREESGDDSVGLLRCPRCRREMEKEELPAPADFHLDRCESCELIWLDGGELAKVQLFYENSPAGRARAEERERWASMSDDKRAEVEARIDNLPTRDAEYGGIWGAVGQGFLKALIYPRRRRRMDWFRLM